jgi:hypothetical protein
MGDPVPCQKAPAEDKAMGLVSRAKGPPLRDSANEIDPLRTTGIGAVAFFDRSINRVTTVHRIEP